MLDKVNKSLIPHNRRIVPFVCLMFAWTFMLGRLLAFGFRSTAVFWVHKFRYEGWYSLTPLVYKPPQIVFYSFQIILLIFVIGESNVWPILAAVNLGFSYWHPVFMEDLVSWQHSASVGLVVVVLLGFALIWEHHDAEKAVVVLLLLNFLYIYMPNVHALLVIGEPTLVTEYESRKARNGGESSAMTI